jgi:hypothetical protein
MAIIGEELKREHDKMLNEGQRLASDKDRILLSEAKNGGKKPLRMGDLLEGLEDSPIIMGQTAIMLDNMRRFIDHMDETTRMLQIGDFEKFAFRIVRAVFPNLVLHDIASVQAMMQSIGLVFYMKFLYAQSKGSAVAGTDAFKNPNEYYSSEEIDVEQIETGDGVTVAFSGNLAYTPVKPGTVVITYTSSGVTLTITDDGNGNLVGDVGAPSTIIYTSGAYSLTTSAAPDGGTAMDANYLYNMEANALVPQFDMQLTSAPVRAVTRKLRTLWSMEAAQDLMDMHGLDAETEQAGAMVAKLKAEIDREGINDMVRIALGTVAAWSRTPGAGVSITEHYLSFMNRLTEAQNTIFTNTQIAAGNWMVGGTTVANVVETLPGFVRAQKPKGVRGVYKAGSIMDLDFYKDPNFTVSGVSAPGSYIIGLKSDDMFETGYIHAPYIMAYTTNKIELDDFIVRKGTASRYGKKAIDGNFYCLGTVTA